ncbi:MAG: HPr family phosphocarrier protein [Oscillospiraceae bacterium]|nr:HPr family phosphocarrier protein [Oscillospiraceae bacterium]MCI9669004.1 HPr family phosphocarrier protein [Oscillospiraceae bacterium]RKJ53909.1 HPr family phosphocarrier protein [bacterium 1XD42-8]RKJ63188.1 HPr family phosphocarrier protein [bacterium 1XD42-1]
MKQFSYVIQDELGIHARPAGKLLSLAKNYSDTIITISKGEKNVKAGQLIKLMNMGIKKGDKIKIAADGDEEDQAIVALKAFFEENL